MDQPHTLRPEQVSTARSLLGWSQKNLAIKAGVAVSEVKDFESGHFSLEPNKLVAIRRTLEISGILITATDVMRGFHWMFMTERGTSELKVVFTPETSEQVISFTGIFGAFEPGKISISVIQCATPELKKKIFDFVDQHCAGAPHLHRVKKMLADMSDGEFFLLLPTSPSSSAEKLRYELELHKLNHPHDSPTNENLEIFNRLLEHYDLVIPRTDKRFDIGNVKKADRKCRFCIPTSEKKSRFDKEAHAIPASLGNQFLKLCDECDECNEYFGEEIEPNLIEVLNIYRVLLGIKSRGSVPTVNFSQGKLFHDETHGTPVILAESISEDVSGTFCAQLGRGQPIVPQNVYRALSKIALSVIPETELPKLSKTIRWVRYGEHSSMSLPKVATAVVPLPANPSAQIALYIRKGPNPNMPHVVCEFRLGCYLFVYVLPFSDLDEGDLVGFFEDEDFKQTFQHYAQVPLWGQQDYSGIEKVQVNQSIRFQPQDRESS